jgi:hypothetical protein
MMIFRKERAVPPPPPQDTCTTPKRRSNTVWNGECPTLAEVLEQIDAIEAEAALTGLVVSSCFINRWRPFSLRGDRSPSYMYNVTAISNED